MSRSLQVKPQVDRSIYFGPGYINPARFASYAYQIREILALAPKKVLEVGIGNGLVSYMLRQAGMDVTTFDFDESLQPDIVGSVAEMPIADGSFDVVSCCEVLEHIPFGMVPMALAEIHRVSSRHALISVPDCRRFYKLECSLPKIGRRRLGIQVPFLPPRPNSFGGEHYWEIGKAGYPLRRFEHALAEAGFGLCNSYRLWELSWHRMFVLSTNARSRQT